MKAKKLFGILLAGAMALSAVAGLAACGGGKDPDKPDTPVDPDPPVVDPTDPSENPNKDWDGTIYSLVGTGSSETLWKCNWDPASTDTSLIFKASRQADGTEIHTLTVDLYEGDEFQVIHDHAWAGQMGSTYVAVDSQQYLTSAPGGGDMPNISVVKGKSGVYELTVKAVPTSTGGKTVTIEAELKEAFPEIVALKLLNTDGSTIQPTNYTQSMRDIGRYYKKGATVPAVPYRPGDEYPDPYMMTFDGWNKEDGTTKWEGGTIDANMTLKIRYTEEENPDFIADQEGAEYWIVGDTEHKFEHDTAYTQHNVYTRTQVALHKGDKLQFAWADGTSKYDWINMADLLFSKDKDSEQAVVIQDGFYSIILVVTVNEAKKVQGMVISIERTGSILSGYYLVGTPVERNWGSTATDPELANNKGLFFTQDKDNENIWTLTVTITADMVPNNWDHVVTSAECKIKCIGVEGDWGVGAENGTAGANNIVLAPGKYKITFNSSTKVVSWETVS